MVGAVPRAAPTGPQGFEALRAGFPPGAVAPLTALVERRAGRSRRGDVEAVRTRSRAGRASPRSTDTGRRSTDGRVAALTVDLRRRSRSSSRRSTACERLRDGGGAPGPTCASLLGRGLAASGSTSRRAATRDLKVVIPLVLLVVFLTLVVLLRALVAPLYLLATVILSFLGTLGVSLLVFRTSSTRTASTRPCR